MYVCGVCLLGGVYRIELARFQYGGNQFEFRMQNAVPFVSNKKNDRLDNNKNDLKNKILIDSLN